MKRLLLLAALAASVLFPASCGNNSSAATGASAATSSSGTPGDIGEGNLAYTVDGVRTVVKRPASSIFINEVSRNTAKGTVRIEVTIFPSAELFKFTVADKGTTEIVHYRPSFGEEKTEATYLSHAGQNYYGDHVSVAISAVDAAHVAGTFSGTFSDDGGKSVNVTDGSFDLPMKVDK